MTPEELDMFVIGGGINGAGFARDAAGRGLSVALCEKGDLAEGTSSRSGKLVHGGLRYLEYYEFRLVREALIEREVLMNAAPHIIWPLRFVLPHSPQDRPAWLVRLGLFLYDHLGGRRKLPGTRSLDLRRDPEGAPLLDQYTRGFEYSDCWVDDARLVTLNALDAAERGALVLTRAPAVSARREDGRWRITTQNSLTGETREFLAKCLVNAAGPWVNRVVDRITPPPARRNMDLVAGTHIEIAGEVEQGIYYTEAPQDQRAVFTMPWQGHTMIGTTEQPFTGDPATVAPTQAEIDYLLAVHAHYFPAAKRELLGAWAGLRVLPHGEGDAFNRPREVLLPVDRKDKPRLVSIYGGKLTGYRLTAEKVMEILAPSLPPPKRAANTREIKLG